MKIGVLGAGISGLSVAHRLKGKYDIEVLEKNETPGGIARTTNVDGITYHTVGGHCFNSKYQDVLGFVFQEILPIEQWNKIKRNSKIKFHNHEIDYPIEFSIKQIYDFDKDLARNITADFFRANDIGDYKDLEDWFRKKFGNTLAEEYFIPYNTKIWNRSLKEMSAVWIEDKLPIPNETLFFDGLMSKANDKMAHAEFFYPKSNNQNTFIDALSKDLHISFNYTVKTIRKTANNKWIINDDKEYDLIINTTPLNQLIFSIDSVPESVLNAAQKLKCNGVSNTLWKTKSTNKTWTYIPSKEMLFHRYIHIGSFFTPTQGYSISEVIGNHSFEEMSKDGLKDDFLIEPLAHSYSDWAYVVFDNNYLTSKTIINNYLDEIGIYTLGRFGEWQYYNMDVCIKKAIDLAEKISTSNN